MSEIQTEETMAAAAYRAAIEALVGRWSAHCHCRCAACMQLSSAVLDGEEAKPDPRLMLASGRDIHDDHTAENEAHIGMKV